MKKFSVQFLFYSFLIISFTIISSVSVKAETVSGVKTVVDYYLQLPDEYFQCETGNILRKKDKLALIKKKNIKKGYINAATQDGGIPVEIALFTDDYMGIEVLAVNVKCQEGCMCRRLVFFFVSEGKLMETEGELIFPKTEDIEKAAGVTEGYQFILADDGKNILVADEKSGKVLLKIEWSGGTFNIK